MQIFRVTFHNQGKVYQLYAETVRNADLAGFVELHRLLFDERSGVVIDPSEERLKSEFAGVSRILVPLYAVIRIDQVEKRGQSKIFELDANANVSYFPGPIHRPTGDRS